MKRTMAEFELADGTTHKVRVTLPSKLQWSRSARANGWDLEDPQQNAFVAWHAGKLAGHVPEDMSYEDFTRSGCTDVDISLEDAPTTAKTEDAEPGPTN